MSYKKKEQKSNLVRVKISEYRVSESPAVLCSYGLGSCVGLALYDPVKKIGGLAHILLPGRSNSGSRSSFSGKYAEEAVEKMVEEMLKKGCVIERLQAKLVGGADMFSTRYNPKKGLWEKRGIGTRNIISVQKKLAEYNIPIVAKEVGGEIGRTLEFDTTNGKIRVFDGTGREMFI